MESLHSPGTRPPLAVIGLSFRLPGGAETTDAFWDMLVSKRSASTLTPRSRFNPEAHYNADASRIGSLSYRGGNFLEGDPIDAFDPLFFSIGSTEAHSMDPVHRLTLETVYRALENAGLSMESVAGTKTAVFAGSSSTDYATIMNKDPEMMAKYHATGASSNMMANKVSWCFNLTGPSASVDAACNSSLTAFDLVCQSIWSGDATMGLACGGNVILTPESGMWLDNIGVLSKDSQCFTLDQRANGYARGEGFGVLVIKPVSAALRDGDTIRAVIRSSGSNSNGKSAAGLTQPSPEAQYNLIRDTYAKAGLDLASTRFVEAHGTGTPLGDSVEFGAIGAAFGPFRTHDEPLYVGSVKSNIGHLEGASGVAGVIKAVLMLEAGVILPNAHFLTMNPKIDAKSLRIAVARDALPWPSKGLRRISVQCFGFGGANTHVVLDDTRGFLHTNGLDIGRNATPVRNSSIAFKSLWSSVAKIATPRKEMPNLERVFVWSADDENGIRRIKNAWSNHLSSLNLSNKSSAKAEKYIARLAYTLYSRRSHLSWRAFSVASDVESLSSLMDRISSPIRASLEPKLVYVFTGQGSQWFAMGRELIERFELFRRSLEDSSAVFRSLGCKWNVIDELRKDKSRTNVNNALYSQPLCTALQVALVELLESFNVHPTAVVGHSSGEIAAAFCAKAISRESALKLAYWRGVLAAQLALSGRVKGGMMAVGLSSNEAREYLRAVAKELGESRLVIACVNSPTSVTVSGDADHLDYLQQLLNRSSGIFNRRLKVDVAYHSYHMEVVSAEYLKRIGNLEIAREDAGSNEVIMASSVTGSWVSANELRQPQYWVRNLVSPVLFSDALTTVCTDKAQSAGSHYVLVEVGPHSALQGASKDTCRSAGMDNLTYIALLVRDVSAVNSVLGSAGQLHCLGCPVRLDLVNGDATRAGGSVKEQSLRPLIDLPQYSFNHSKSYWHESRLSRDYRLREFPWHDLLGVRDSDWNPLEAKWRHIIRTSDQPWVEDHKVNGNIVFPAAGMFTMAIEAAKQMADPHKRVVGFSFKNITFHSVFKIPAGVAGVEANIHLKPRAQRDGNTKGNPWYDFRVYTFDGDTKEWQQKCYGSVEIIYSLEDRRSLDAGYEFQQWQNVKQNEHKRTLQRCSIKADVRRIYDAFGDLGYGYGPPFRAILALTHDGSDSAVAEVQTHRDPAQPEDHVIHPATLDCIFQTMFMATVAGGTERLRLAVPSYFERLWISNEGLNYPSADRIKVSATARRTGMREARASITAFDEAGNHVLLDIEGLRTTDVASDEQLLTADQKEIDLCHHLYWKPDLDLMTAEEVLSYCSCLSRSSTDAEPVEFFNAVDFLVTAYIRRALKLLDSEGDKDCRVNHHTTKYLNWMRRRMELINTGNSLSSKLEWESRLDDSNFINRVEDKIAATNASGLLYTTIGANLPKLLTGVMDPLHLMFEGDLVKNHYYGTWESLPAVKAFRRYVDALVHKNPNVNILEVGAGTGATTVQLMKTLTTTGDADQPCGPRFSRFDYTDLSPFFFEAAERQYRELGSRIRFKKLDIENEPESQGFEAGSYDVIVAAMVLHATSDLTRSLEHCRKLLKVGGKLILWEGTVPDGLRTNFAFGLLEGWWLGSETYRKLSPCVDERQWDALLGQTGFTGADLVFRDYEDDNCHEFSIIISTAISEHEPAQKDTVGAEVTIICEPEQQDTANELTVILGRSRDVANIRLLNIDDAVNETGAGLTDAKAIAIFLLELERPVWRDMTADLFPKLQKLLARLQKVLWVNREGEPALSLIDGISRVLNSELGSTMFTQLALRHHKQGEMGYAQQIWKAFRQIMSSGAHDTEYTEDEHGFLRIPRLMTSRSFNNEIKRRTEVEQRAKLPWKQDTPLRLVVGSLGLLDTLHFVEDGDVSNQPLGPSQVEIIVHSAGLNFKDVLVALGSLNERDVGCEIVGVVTGLGSSAAKESRLNIGDRVASIVTGCYKTSVRCNWRSVAKVPDTIALSTAAAIPVNFTTAWYALHEIARIQPGETVLIHSAAGGTGQAAIQVAKYFGGTIFATVGSELKKQFLVQQYGLQEDHIFSSRDSTFASGIHRLTDGKGVDVVLNSLSGNSLIASWECVAPYGRFVEIGKKDIVDNSNLPMKMFEKHVSFTAFEVSVLNQDRPTVVRKALEHVLDLTAQGRFGPAQPMQVFGISDLQKAFRSLQSGNTIGKIVIEFRPDDIVEALLKPKPTLSLDPNATYLIAGGLGGLGRTMASWFIQQGARNLILLSRSGTNSTTAKGFIEALEARGAHVAAPACDITNEAVLRAAVGECLLTMPPIKGCIQASMVLHEAPFEALSFDSWDAAVAPKVAGSYNLHTILPKGMDFFIMLSSVSGVWGSRGLSNYAAGNAFQDSLARYRVAQGERATAFDLGPFYEVGWMADRQNLQTLYKQITNGPVTKADLFALLDYFCNPTTQISKRTAIECQTVVVRVVAEGQMAFYLEKPMFRSIALDVGLNGIESESTGHQGAKPEEVDLAAVLSEAATLTAATRAVTEALAQKMALTLALERHEIDTTLPIHRYGVDSLVAVELRNWLAKTIHSEVAILDFMGSVSVEGVSKIAISKSRYRKAD
ncbi:hypothetical protein F5Y04DRAFT_290474 [Hypomontagnella monticulosa]|nr:hypothetical protein F5Y04DRAFT_290474 [Hypomontagnella monticulosa]